MDDKYHKKGRSVLKLYMSEAKRFQTAVCTTLSALLVNRASRTPTFIGWLVLICVTFILASIVFRQDTNANHSDQDLVRGDIARFQANQMIFPKVPEPDLQEAEFKALHEENIKAKGIHKMPVFDPNKHDNVAHRLNDNEQVGRFGFPNPKDFPVALIKTPSLSCTSDPKVTLLLLVHTEPSQTGARSSIRRSWAFMEEGWTGPVWKTVFVLGRAGNKFDKISKEEADMYGDMLIGDFNDSPLEGTRKFMLGIKWTSDTLHSCMPEYVMKTEDKVYMNMKPIMSWLEARYKGQTGVYIGRLQRNDIPVRDVNDPHHVVHADFAADTYPDYMTSPVWMMSSDVVIKFSQEMMRSRPIAVEDAFVGILAHRTGVTPKHNDHFQMVRKPTNICRYLHMFFLFNMMPHEHQETWRRIQNAKKECGDVQIVDARKGFHRVGNK